MTFHQFHLKQLPVVEKSFWTPLKFDKIFVRDFFCVRFKRFGSQEADKQREIIVLVIANCSCTLDVSSSCWNSRCWFSWLKNSGSKPKQCSSSGRASNPILFSWYVSLTIRPSFIFSALVRNSGHPLGSWPRGPGCNSPQSTMLSSVWNAVSCDYNLNSSDRHSCSEIANRHATQKSTTALWVMCLTQIHCDKREYHLMINLICITSTYWTVTQSEATL